MNLSFGGKALNMGGGVCAPIPKSKASKKEDDAGKQRLEKLADLQKGRSWCEEDLANFASTREEGDKWKFYKVNMVNEMKCYIPGCAPIEVCVVFSREGWSSKTGKIFKPVKDVSREDVEEFISKFCSMEESASNKASGASASTEAHPFKCPCCDPELKVFDRMLAGELDAGW